MGWEEVSEYQPNICHNFVGCLVWYNQISIAPCVLFNMTVLALTEIFLILDSHAASRNLSAIPSVIRRVELSGPTTAAASSPPRLARCFAGRVLLKELCSGLLFVKTASFTQVSPVGNISSYLRTALKDTEQDGILPSAETFLRMSGATASFSLSGRRYRALLKA